LYSHETTEILQIRRCVAEAIEDGGEILCGETKDELTLPHHLSQVWSNSN